MHYLHGQRDELLYHEMDSYERIISDFKRKAKNFHVSQYRKAKKRGNETPEERQARLFDKKKEFEHLKNEAAHAKTRAQVQVRLDKYMKHTMTQSQMKAERHYKTDILEENMRLSGRPKPSPKSTAHHIVPGKGKTELAANARIELHLYDIRINDPDNGVWMVHKKAHKGHWSMAKKAETHNEIHTENYERWVLRRLRQALDESDVRSALRTIGNRLLSGTQPKEVTIPPDENWNGDG